MKTILSAGLIALAAGTAMAGTVQLGVTPLAGGTTAMNARYRGANSGWEQAMAGTGGTNVANGYVLNDLSPGINAAWDFSVSFEVGQGYTFTMTRGATVKTLIWRNDVAAPNGQNKVTMSDGDAATDNAVNSLRLVATARDFAGRAMNITNLSFTAAGQTITGSLSDVNALSAGGFASSSTAIVSSTDMRSFNWTLSGTLEGINPVGAGTNISERIKFDIYAEQNGNYVIIPLPGAAWAGMAGLATLGVAQRIRRRKMA